jgi:cell division transport system permease protein
MTADAPRLRLGPLLAPNAGNAVSSFLFIAALSLVASLIVIACVAAGRGVLDWRERLVGSATVVIRAAGLESPDAAAARGAEALDAVGGVARAWPLDPAGADGVISRLVDGKSNAGGAPRLVAVEFKAGRTPSIGSLSRALVADGLHARVDDHRPLTSPVVRAAALVGLAVAALLAGVAGLVGMIAAFVTRRRIAAQPELVNLLRLAGAADGFIAGLFAAYSARAAAFGGAAGAVAAALAVAAWRLAGPAAQGAGSGAFPGKWADLAALAAWPLIAALVGGLAARLAVRAALIGAP